jgi:anti-sigma factor RsiW
VSGIDCSAARDLLAEHARGELDAATRTEIERHLAVCEECAGDLAFVDWVGRNRLEPPAGLADRIRAAVREDQTSVAGTGQNPVTTGPARLQIRRTTWGLAAAAVAVLALGISTMNDRGAAPSEDEVWTPFFDGVRSVWVGGDGMVAGAPVLDDLSGLSDDDLAALLEELEG